MICREPEVTYILRGEGRGEFVRIDVMRRILTYSLRGEREEDSSAQKAFEESDATYKLGVKGEGVRQPRWHAKNPEVTYILGGEGRGSSSAQKACEASRSLTNCEVMGEVVSQDGIRRIRGNLQPGRGEFVSPDGVQRIRGHLHPAR